MAAEAVLNAAYGASLGPDAGMTLRLAQRAEQQPMDTRGPCAPSHARNRVLKRHGRKLGTLSRDTLTGGSVVMECALRSVALFIASGGRCSVGTLRQVALPANLTGTRCFSGTSLTGRPVCLVWLCFHPGVARLDAWRGDAVCAGEAGRLGSGGGGRTWLVAPPPPPPDPASAQPCEPTGH